MLRKAAKYPYRLIINVLGLVEKGLLIISRSELKYPPIFIIGPPRSGTTLLYQLMVHCFHLTYISTIPNLFFTFPVLTSKITKPILKPYQSDFKSYYGWTVGLNSPQQGRIWKRWFPISTDISRKNGQYVDSGYLTSRQKREIKKTVAGMEKVYKEPFINKNLGHSMRISALVDIFPNALFLQIKRDPTQVALSILKSRKRNLNDISQWWSVIPREINQLKNKSYLEQIAGQVYYVEKNIDEQARTVGMDKFYTVTYKGLCEDPRAELNGIRSFLDSKGASLLKKHRPPDSFRYRQIGKNTFTKEQDALAKLVKRYHGSTLLD